MIQRDKTSSKHYLSNKNLLAAFLESREKDEMTPEFARMLQMLAERYSYHQWFNGYTYRDDMVAEAVLNLCTNWRKFDPDKQTTPNPFAYYTQAVYRSFLSYLAAERNQSNIKDMLRVESGNSASWNYNAKMAGSDGAFMSHESD